MSDQPKKQELPPLEVIETMVEILEPIIDLAIQEDQPEFLRQKIAEALAAALSDNEAKDARIAELEKDSDYLIDLYAQIHGALNDAGERVLEPAEKGHSRYRSLPRRIASVLRRANYFEARLKSVEGLLEEKLKQVYNDQFGNRYCDNADVDALLARIREAMK